MGRTGKPRIIAIGDNVCDKILTRGKMYPGGQCVNTCVYSSMNGAEAAYLGKFGTDQVAECVQNALSKLHIAMDRCRHFEGENGFACVKIVENERVFVGSNRGGVAREYDYNFNEEDFMYIRGFDLIYTDLNCDIEEDLPSLAALGVPVAFDFSNRWTDEYLKQVCPYIRIAIFSCAHLDRRRREEEMRKAEALGVKIVLATSGEDGSHLLYHGRFYDTPAEKAEVVLDTVGAGDAYFAAFLCHILKSSGEVSWDDGKAMLPILLEGMKRGAQFAAKIVGVEGAFGYSMPIAGRIMNNRI